MNEKEITEYQRGVAEFDWRTEKGQGFLRQQIALALWEIAAALRDANHADWARFEIRGRHGV